MTRRQAGFWESAPKVRKKRDEREFRLTCATADFLRLAVPPHVIWTHFPAGEKRPPAAAARLKRMGLRRSIPDFQFFWQPFVLIEMKADGGTLTKGQKETFPVLESCGYPVDICRSVEEVEAVLRARGVPLVATTYPRAALADLFAR